MLTIYYTYYTYYMSSIYPTMECKQIKPKLYYVFWAIATACVLGGQIYIANSYRYLAELLQLSLTK